ncbi:MAG TPA: dephospho-CoA kinase [Candidatus Omnitrophota bacterium]|nr:dephospho-CoA kinase [Candidatus Omnitrophota bacterium]HQL40845.1 dephospho-CoA kinase [Candidatus Omnitrophota bacterium]
MHIVGITGSFGSGKTTVARLLRERGAKVFDADKAAHALFLPKHPCFKKVVSLFGREILVGGRIDRRRLAKIVFGNPQALKKLCHLTHPLIIQQIKKEVGRYRSMRTPGLFVLDVPLLFEAKLEGLCDYVVVVRSTIRVQIARLQKRNHFSQSEILRRINAQMPIALKAAKADFVIYNQDSIQKTKKQVEELCQELKKKML